MTRSARHLVLTAIFDALVICACRAVEPEGPPPLADASRAVQQGNYPEAIQLLERIIARGGRSDAAKGGLMLGYVYRQLGDEARMIAAWERVARQAPVDTARHLMDSSDTQAQAVKALCSYFFNKQDWTSARRYLSSWRPLPNGCGTCWEMTKTSRAKAVIACCLNLNDAQGTAAHCITALNPWIGGLPAEDCLMLAKLYRNAGQLNDLEVILRENPGLLAPFQQEDRLEVPPALTEILRIYQLEQDGDYRGLIERIEHPATQRKADEVIHRATSEALSRCGRASIRATQQAVLRSTDAKWLLLALARNPSPAAKSAINSVPRRIRDKHATVLKGLSTLSARSGTDELSGITILPGTLPRSYAEAAQRVDSWRND
jgi:hypothetical protein